jgi:hypothetical protein
MKIIKCKTDKTFSELVSIFENVNILELESIFNMSKYFQYIDFVDKDGKNGILAIVADSYQKRLEDFLSKNSIGFNTTDISKDIFFDNLVDSNFTNETGCDITHDVEKFFKYFKENYTTKDDILDKIIEKGVNSLTEFDKSILEK